MDEEMNRGDFEKPETEEELQKESFKTKEQRMHKSFGKRIGSALLIAFAAIVAIFGGIYPFLILIGFIAIGGAWEILHVTKKKYPVIVHVVTYIFVIFLSYWFFIGGNIAAYQADPANYTFSLTNNVGMIYFPFAVVAISFILYFFIAIIDERFTFADVAHFICLGLLLGMGIQSASYLRYHSFFLVQQPYLADFAWFPGYTSTQLKGTWQFEFFLSTLPIVYMALGTVANDTFAWLGGLLFGKHKMNPRVSPNKTWEGFFFGYAGAMIVFLVLGFVCAGVGMPILPMLTMDKWYFIVLLALVLPAFGVLGDLSFSLVKRHYGKKDYSNIFPGHGGILDRFDSYIFTAMGMALLMMLCGGELGVFF